MEVIKTKINKNSTSYQRNHEFMVKELCKLSEKLNESLYQGAPKHIANAKKKGKLLARDRIQLLLDIDSPFLELMPLAGINHDGATIGGNLVSGIGLIQNQLCLVIANLGTNKGGIIDAITLQKILRLNEIALENELLTIYLVESGGADLKAQEKVFNYGGAMFREITRRSKLGIPSISIVFGSSTAGGAYIPGMSDYVVMVKDQAKVFLAGPPLVKMATNEVVDEESLGGAYMHSFTSGVSDYLAETEKDGIRIAREIVSTLKPKHQTTVPTRPIPPPKYGAEEILGVISADLKQPFDCREIIARIVDDSSFSEFKPNYGSSLVTGFAKIHGYSVGIMGNNGVLFSQSANKGTHFIQHCNRNDIPLIFLQNTTGFMVGKTYEEEGIIKHGAKLINAVANSEVPAITIMIGASYGAGNYAMCGRALKPRFLFSYPHAKIAVMGPEQLSGVMEIIQKQAAKKAGKKIDSAKLQKERDMMIRQVEEKSSAYYSSGEMWDDGIIDPRDTRHVLGFCLTVIHNLPIQGTKEYGIFRM